MGEALCGLQVGEGDPKFLATYYQYRMSLLCAFQDNKKALHAIRAIPAEPLLSAAQRLTAVAKIGYELNEDSGALEAEILSYVNLYQAQMSQKESLDRILTFYSIQLLLHELADRYRDAWFHQLLDEIQPSYSEAASQQLLAYTQDFFTWKKRLVKPAEDKQLS